MSNRRRYLKFIVTLAVAVAGSFLLAQGRVCASTILPVTSITPARGSNNGGPGLTIGGSGFVSGASVTIGGAAATILTLNSTNISIAATPPHAAGPVNVIVTNPDGGTGAIVFTYFTDDSLVPGSSTIRRVHIAELRALVDGLRARFGRQPFNWTTDLTVIRALDIIDLRNALRDTYAAAHATAPVFTDPDSALPGITMKAIHITEIRNAVVVLEDLSGFVRTPNFIDVQVGSGSNVVGAYQVSIMFDKTVVSLNPSDVTGGTGAGFDSPLVGVFSDGHVNILQFQTNSAPAGTFTVARIQFTPLQAGTVNLTLSGVVVTDQLGNALDSSFVSLSAAAVTIN